MQTIYTIIWDIPNPTKRADLGSRGLSIDQLDMLIWIAAQHLKHQQDLVPWTHGGEWTASQRAAESRTFRRLEERGLVERLNMNGGGRRTSHVANSESGLEAIPFNWCMRNRSLPP